ncbi:MAG: hypothetical protein ABIP55_03495 [Tepidisphaeraceae bacterium]
MGRAIADMLAANGAAAVYTDIDHAPAADAARNVRGASAFALMRPLNLSSLPTLRSRQTPTTS